MENFAPGYTHKARMERREEGGWGVGGGDGGAVHLPAAWALTEA